MNKTNFGRMTLALGLLALGFSACEKDTDLDGNLNFFYQNLLDKEVTLDEDVMIDLDKDGINDFMVNAYPVSDGQNVTRDVFQLVPLQSNRVLVNTDEESVVALQENATIPLEPGGVFEWDNIADNLLAQRVMQTAPSLTYWVGIWENANKLYAGVQLKKGDLLYPGWIRMSVVANQSKFIVHDASLSIQPNRVIKAGDRP